MNEGEKAALIVPAETLWPMTSTTIASGSESRRPMTSTYTRRASWNAAGRVTCPWNCLGVLHGRELNGASLFVHAIKDSKSILRTCHGSRNIGMCAVLP